MKNKIKGKKLCVVGSIYSFGDYANWLTPLGFELTDDIENNDAYLFCGGSDVGTELYGEKKGDYIGDNPARDKYENEVFRKSGNKPKIGICRGGQYLNVKNGYRLIQHMSHPSLHDVYTYDNKVLEVTSSHHNQFYLEPNNLIKPSPFRLLAWAKKLSRYHFNGENKDYNFPKDYKEPEIVYYNSKSFGPCLSCQMHQEWQPLNHPTVKYSQELVLKFLNNEL
jgi:hypothetical protein